jgi:hypothetical protein
LSKEQGLGAEMMPCLPGKKNGKTMGQRVKIPGNTLVTFQTLVVS